MLTFRCERTGTEQRSGYVKFANLRMNIADYCHPEFGRQYRDYFLSGVKTKAAWERLDGLADKLIEDKVFSEQLMDFFFQSDAGGKLEAQTCRELYDKLVQNDGKSLTGFISLLKECCDNNSDFIWE